jgi:hypothetical protein
VAWGSLQNRNRLRAERPISLELDLDYGDAARTHKQRIVGGTALGHSAMAIVRPRAGRVPRRLARDPWNVSSRRDRLNFFGCLRQG